MSGLWGKVPVRVRAQAARFARLFVVTLVAQAPAILKVGEPVSWSVLGALIVGAGETAWRQYRSAPDAAQHRGQ